MLLLSNQAVTQQTDVEALAFQRGSGSRIQREAHSFCLSCSPSTCAEKVLLYASYGRHNISSSATSKTHDLMCIMLKNENTYLSYLTFQVAVVPCYICATVYGKNKLSGLYEVLRCSTSSSHRKNRYASFLPSRPYLYHFFRTTRRTFNEWPVLKLFTYTGCAAL